MQVSAAIKLRENELISRKKAKDNSFFIDPPQALF